MTTSPFTISKEQLCSILNSFEGAWEGQGVDTFPNPGPGPNPITTNYSEYITFGKWFDTNNPGSGSGQTLTGIQYYTQLKDAKTGVPMHQETGFWLFDVADFSFMKVISIPRGISILAGGTFMIANDGTLNCSASASVAKSTYGILNEPFLNKDAPTTNFTIKIMQKGNSMSYSENSTLLIQGMTFNHTDKASLVKKS